MSDQMRMFAIVVASGTSTRFGSNKLEELIGTETVLHRSVRIAQEACDGVVVVIDPAAYSGPDVYAVIAGGDTRSQSVRNGLTMVPDDVEIIAVHDAARPGATAQLYARGKSLIEGGAAGAVPAIDVADTIKKIEDDSTLKTLDRSSLRAVQTPQVFNAQILRAAYENGDEGTDDASLVEALGQRVVLFEGSHSNRKITTPQDLGGLASQKGQTQRIGYGYDIHPFGVDVHKKLVLGGTEIDFLGLEGHSDSDAVIHALTDALLSAIGAPDLGTLFPASDAQNENVSSGIFLEKAVTLVHNEGFILGNASIVINAQQPKLIEHIPDMKKTLGEILSPISNGNTLVSITPKHGEGIGEIGRGEAIAVHATVLLVPSAN